MATTSRLALPLLQAGQAQKELWHNEALALIDLAVQAEVVAIGSNDPPASPTVGACWIVGTTPSGDWSGQAGALAGWTEGGWRFVLPREGMAVWNGTTAAVIRYRNGQWRSASTVAAPSGGTTVDMEARAVLGAIIAALRDQGLLAS